MAITSVQSKLGGSAAPPAATTYNSAVAIGNVLTCGVISGGNGNPGTVTITDGSNGTWTPLVRFYDATSQFFVGLYYIVSTVNLAVTVSCTQGGNAAFGQLMIGEFTGFLGTPTADATISPNTFSAAASTACTTGNFTNGFASELILGLADNSSNGNFNASTTGSDGSWGGGYRFCVYKVQTAASSTTNFSNTLTANSNWDIAVAGIYDSVAVVTPSPIYYRRNVLYFI